MPKKMRIKACKDLTPTGLARRQKAWGKLTSRQQAERWARALESGPFGQTVEFLTDRCGLGNRCVLGVLSEVSGNARASCLYEYEPDLYYPPIPTILGKNRSTFVDLNDRRGYSFGQLAQYIRALLDDADLKAFREAE